MIGYRLRSARAAASLSLRDLSAQINGLATAKAIRKYERNEDMPRSGVLLALADALDVTEEYLLSDGELVLEGVEFRKKPNTTAREEAAIAAKSIHLLERYLLIEDLLHLKSVDWKNRGVHRTPYTKCAMRKTPQDRCGRIGGWAMIRSRNSPSCWRSAESRCSLWRFRTLMA